LKIKYMTKKTYKLTGLECPSCAALLESDLEDAGIKCSCSYAKSELIVELEKDKLDEKKVKDIVSKLGYCIS
jgi:copper chaperone CopZ